MWGIPGSLALALALATASACAKPAAPPVLTQPAVSVTGEASHAPLSSHSTDRELASARTGEGENRPGAGPLGSPNPGFTPTSAAPPAISPVQESPRGAVLKWPESYFAFASAELEPHTRLAVERLARALTKPDALNRRLIVEGHADNIGSARYNLALSRRRAETVARELIARGVRRGRIAIVAFGDTRPAAPNRHSNGSDNPDGRAKNRRVEALLRS